MPVKWKNNEPWIDSAQFREPITFLVQSITSGVAGAAASWAPASPPDTAYAEIQPIRAADVIKGGQDVSKVWCVVTIRYRSPGRQATERFQDTYGNVYVVEAVENLTPGRKKYQQLTCELIGNNT